MEHQARSRTLLTTVVTAALMNISMKPVASQGPEPSIDPRVLLEESIDQLIDSVLDTADHYRLASRSDESLSLLEAGVRVCADAGHPERCRARILNGRGRTLTQARRYQEAAESLEQARVLATRSGDALTEAAALNALGNNLLRQEDFDVDRTGERLITLHEAALTIHRRLATEANAREESAVYSGLGESLFQLAFLDESQGRVEQAEERYRACADAAERGGNKIILGFCLRHLGYLAAADGKIDEAEQLFRRSLEARREGGSVAGTGFAMNTLAELLYQQRSDPKGALSLLQEGLELMESAEEYAGMAAILLTLATIHEQEDREGEARAYAQRCLDVAREHDVAFVIEDAERIVAASGKNAR